MPTIRYRVHGAGVSLDIHDPDHLGLLGYLFRAYQVSGEAGGSGSEESGRVTVRGHDGGSLVVWGAQRALCRSEEELVIAVESALAEMLLAACADWALLHASGAVVGDRAVLALGPAGAGKSSLALSWSLTGLPALGDDIVLVDSAGRVSPFMRLFKVAPDLLRARGVGPETTPGWLPGSVEAWFDPTSAGGWTGAAVPVAVVALVQHRSRGGVVVREMGRAEVLNVLLHSLFPSGLPAAASVDRLAEVAAGARALEVTFDSAAEAAASLAALVP